MPDQLFIEDLPRAAQFTAFSVQISNNDQRFTAAVPDATGRLFVSWHDEHLRIVICELMTVEGRLKLVYRVGPVPTSDKCSCVALAIPADNTIMVFYGARTEATGGTTGPFPLLCETYTINGIVSVSGELARLQQQLDALGSSGGDSTLQARVGAMEQVVETLGERMAQAGLVLKGSTH